MKAIIRKSFGIIAGALFAISSVTANAAHESNNRAALESDENLATGKAIVNYVKGKESWTATVSIDGLEDGVYFFVVRFNSGGMIGDFQEVCMLDTDGVGGASCSANGFDLGGFHEALIIDMDGNIILSGFFDRRGGKRVSD